YGSELDLSVRIETGPHSPTSGEIRRPEAQERVGAPGLVEGVEAGGAASQASRAKEDDDRREDRRQGERRPTRNAMTPASTANGPASTASRQRERPEANTSGDTVGSSSRRCHSACTRSAGRGRDARAGRGSGVITG